MLCVAAARWSGTRRGFTLRTILVGWRDDTCDLQDILNEGALSCRIHFSVARIAACKLLFQRCISGSERRVLPECITQSEVALPVLASRLHKVEVMRPKLASAKELPPRDSALSSIHVPRSLKYRHVDGR